MVAQDIAAAIRAILTSKTEAEIINLLPSAVHGLSVTGGDARKPYTLGDDAARAGLIRVYQAAEELYFALQELAPQAAAAFRNVSVLKTHVRIIGIIADNASRAEDIAQYTGFKPSDKPFIRPAVILALKCALVFATVSDKNPTIRVAEGKAYGPYLDFVTAVFKARRLRASPESSAREALKLLQLMDKSSKKTT